MPESTFYTSVNLTPRKEWGAKDKTDGYIELLMPTQQVLHTFTDSDYCYTKKDCVKTMKALQDLHMAQGHIDINFNFVVCGDGSVYEGRGWYAMPDHLDHPEFAETTLLIAHVGRPGFPSNYLLHTAQEFLRYGVEHNYLKFGFKYHLQFDRMSTDENSGSSPMNNLKFQKKPIAGLDRKIVFE